MAGLAVLAVACTDRAGDPAAAVTAQGGPVGFRDVGVDISLADGTVLAWCVWVADDAAQRARGLMEVTDLEGRAGMLFRYGAPSTGEFYMLRTRIPLDIVFFDSGRFVSSRAMAPCPDDDDDPACPRYGADGPYTEALELPLGGLAAAGIGAGSVLAVRGDCP